MKRVVTLAILCLCILPFCACGDQSSSIDSDDITNIISELAAAATEQDDLPSSQPSQSNPVNTSEPAEPSPALDVEAENAGIGANTLEECEYGFYVMYPDNTLDKYYSGELLDWDIYHPSGLVESNDAIEENQTHYQNGTLVLFCPYNIISEGLYPVVESGYSLMQNGLIGLFCSDSSSGKLLQWKATTDPWSTFDYESINGIDKSEFEFPSTEGRRFSTFPPNEEFTIGIVEGTTLTYKTYSTKCQYFLHDEQSETYSLTATTDGYAVFNFANTPPGDYVFHITCVQDDTHYKSLSTYLHID